MPVDEAGNRADIVMDPGATCSRMNLGRLYEHYLNACRRDLTTEIRNTLGMGPTTINMAVLPTHPMLEHVWSRLMRFYELTSPRIHKWFMTGEYKKTREEHLATIIKEGIELYYPGDNEVEPSMMVNFLEKEFKPTYGPVKYIGYSGKPSVTKFPVRISQLYIILLEKTGDDWSALSSGKLQNFGVLSQITSRDKFSQAVRNQAIRAFGETEVRILASYIGPLATAEILDRNNSIATHKQVLNAIFRADKPTSIDEAVDRRINPLGNARPLQLVKHLALCGGWKYVYEPHVLEKPDSGLNAYEE